MTCKAAGAGPSSYSQSPDAPPPLAAHTEPIFLPTPQYSALSSSGNALMKRQNLLNGLCTLRLAHFIKFTCVTSFNYSILVWMKEPRSTGG